MQAAAAAMASFAGSENDSGFKILRRSSGACSLKAWDKHALVQVSINHNLCELCTSPLMCVYTSVFVKVRVRIQILQYTYNNQRSATSRYQNKSMR
jgi:hypothetical protein